MKNSNCAALIFTVILTACHQLYATTRVVNNNVFPVTPGQYMTFSSAVSAASDGDTILVTGSPTPYGPGGTVTIDKQLVIIGQGYNPKGANNYSSKLSSIIRFTTSASGSIFCSLEFLGEVQAWSGGSLSAFDNVTFSRNLFRKALTLSVSAAIVSNIKIINNIFFPVPGSESYGQITTYTHVGSVATDLATLTGFFTNNIFLIGLGTTSINIGGASGGYRNVSCANNLFLNGSNSIPVVTFGTVGSAPKALKGFSDQTISNNIFYNCMPVETGSRYVFLNNLSYAGSLIPLMPTDYFIGSVFSPATASSGTANINNEDPKLIQIFSNPDNPYFDFDLDNIGLQAGSPCINAGSDSTDIGPTGGLYPIYGTNSNFLTGEPPLPSVRTMHITGSNSVPIGGTLNVTVSAKKLN